MSRELCQCGHTRLAHWLGAGCVAGRCLNVCMGYVPIVLPDPGERPVFGVHRIPRAEAWTPEHLSGYWDQDERWKP